MKQAILMGLTGALFAFAAQASGDLDWTRLESADVVVIGEVHDNGFQHDNQADIIRRLGPKAVVFEMMRQASEAGLADVPPAQRTAEGVEKLLDWEARGWPDFTLYWPIFEALGDAAIFGAEQPRAAVRAAFQDGAAASFGAGAERFGLDQPLAPEESERREAEQLEAHCNALPPETLPDMVEAQRFRDAQIASAVLRAREAVGSPVVLITGNGHARKDWGAPALLRIAAPDLSVVAIGQFEEEANEHMEFDDFLITAAVSRPDPCEAFLKRDN